MRNLRNFETILGMTTSVRLIPGIHVPIYEARGQYTERQLYGYAGHETDWTLFVVEAPWAVTELTPETLACSVGGEYRGFYSYPLGWQSAALAWDNTDVLERAIWAEGLAGCTEERFEMDWFSLRRDRAQRILETEVPGFLPRFFAQFRTLDTA